MFAKVGRPILGMYLKIGQNGTRVGRYLKKVTKKWDILYERSLKECLVEYATLCIKNEVILNLSEGI